MAPSTHLRVKNWERFQHYKQRNPPWIKLHNALLDDYAFSCLQDASKWLAVGMWLLASRFDNRIPNDPAWIGERIGARSPVDFAPLLSAGFIECYDDASGVLAECLQPASKVLLQRERSAVDLDLDLTPALASLGQPPSLRSGARASKPNKANPQTAIPPGWLPNDTHRRIAEEERVDLTREETAFRDHAEATGRKLQSWDAGFRTWLHRAPSMNGKASAPEKPPPPKPRYHMTAAEVREMYGPPAESPPW